MIHFCRNSISIIGDYMGRVWPKNRARKKLVERPENCSNFLGVGANERINATLKWGPILSFVQICGIFGSDPRVGWFRIEIERDRDRYIDT